MHKLLALVIAFALLSCSGTADNEVVAETFPNGKTKRVFIEEGEGDNKVKVYEKLYHENGKVYMEGPVTNGLRNGTWKSYYASGQQWSELSFQAGKKHGASKNWHENGKLRFEGAFTDDKKSGTWITYNEDGSKSDEVNYDSE